MKPTLLLLLLGACLAIADDQTGHRFDIRPGPQQPDGSSSPYGDVYNQNGDHVGHTWTNPDGSTQVIIDQSK